MPYVHRTGEIGLETEKDLRPYTVSCHPKHNVNLLTADENVVSVLMTALNAKTIIK